MVIIDFQISMYKSLKNILKRVIPKSFITKNEQVFRRIIAVFYAGHTYECNLCGFKLSKFVSVNSNSLLCPKCGSISRSRQLWDVLESEIEHKRILHFSPSLSFQNKMRQSNAQDYISTDYMGEFQAMKQLDIEAIDEPDNYFDLVICYHVLEHIKNDNKAMSELLRILKPNGSCYIQTPFKQGEIYEDDSITTETDRLIHFGQKDHVRIYSVEGLVNRLEDVGFKTDVLQLKNDKDNRYGFPQNEIIVVAKKI